MAAVCSCGRDGEDTALRKRLMGAPQPAKWGKNRELGMGVRRGEHPAQSSGQDARPPAARPPAVSPGSAQSGLPSIYSL